MPWLVTPRTAARPGPFASFPVIASPKQPQNVRPQQIGQLTSVKIAHLADAAARYV